MIWGERRERGRDFHESHTQRQAGVRESSYLVPLSLEISHSNSVTVLAGRDSSPGVGGREGERGLGLMFHLPRVKGCNYERKCVVVSRLLVSLSPLDRATV